MKCSMCLAPVSIVVEPIPSKNGKVETMRRRFYDETGLGDSHNCMDVNPDRVALRNDVLSKRGRNKQAGIDAAERKKANQAKMAIRLGIPPFDDGIIDAE